MPVVLFQFLFQLFGQFDELRRVLQVPLVIGLQDLVLRFAFESKWRIVRRGSVMRRFACGAPHVDKVSARAAKGAKCNKSFMFPSALLVRSLYE